MRPLSCIPEQDVAVLRPRLIESHDPQVVDRGHDVRMRLGVVQGRGAAGEGRGAPEPAVGGAEVADGVAAGVSGGGVGDEHVFFCGCYVFLFVVLVWWCC